MSDIVVGVGEHAPFPALEARAPGRRRVVSPSRSAIAPTPSTGTVTSPRCRAALGTGRVPSNWGLGPPQAGRAAAGAGLYFSYRWWTTQEMPWTVRHPR